MVERDISYVMDGDTFVGRYRVHADGAVPSVSLRFGNQVVSTRSGAASAETVARRLLSELVRAKIAAEVTPGLAA